MTKTTTNPDKDTIKITAVGDIMLGDHPLCIGHGVRTTISKMDKEHIFQNVASVLKKGDIVFGNLECVLSDIGLRDASVKVRKFRASSESIKELVYGGFNILSLANNHALEHGTEVLMSTINYLNEHNISYIPTQTGVTQKPLIIKKNNIKMAFLAYCLVPDNTSHGFTDNYSSIISDIKSSVSVAGIVIVSLHWGYEFMALPSPKQIQLAHDIIDAGATVIIGHHPHILQGMELYNKGIIAYSLGNFIFDLWLGKTKDSMILELDVDKNNIVTHRIIPTSINENFQPIILSGDSKDKSLARNRDLSDMLDKSKYPYDSENAYKKEALRILNVWKKDARRYVVSNFYRYSPYTLIELTKNWLYKKLTRR